MGIFFKDRLGTKIDELTVYWRNILNLNDTLNDKEMKSNNEIIKMIIDELRFINYKGKKVSIFDKPKDETIKYILFLIEAYDNQKDIKDQISKYKNQMARKYGDLRLYSEEYEEGFKHLAEFLLIQDAFEKHGVNKKESKEEVLKRISKKMDDWLGQLPFIKDSTNKEELEFLGKLCNYDEMQEFIDLYKSLLYLDDILLNKQNNDIEPSNETLEKEKQEIIEWLEYSDFDPEDSIVNQLIRLNNLTSKDGKPQPKAFKEFINKCVELIENESKNGKKVFNGKQEEYVADFNKLAEYIGRKLLDERKKSRERLEYIERIYKKFPDFSPFKISQIFTMSHFKKQRKGEDFSIDDKSNKMRKASNENARAVSVYERAMVANATKGRLKERMDTGTRSRRI